MEILSIQNIVKQYDTTKALDNISFSVDAGSVFGLLGPNGAGKTTLLRIINHITLQDSGDVLINGKNISFKDNNLIGYLPEERGLYQKMKVREQISYFAQLKGIKRSNVNTNKWLSRFDIVQHSNRVISELSKGNQQKVQIICAMIHNPKILLLDEPFSGFDPMNAKILNDIIHELSASGTTIILSSHNMESVEQLCESIVLINQGHNILCGKVNDIKNRYRNNRYMITLSSPINTNNLFDEFKILKHIESKDNTLIYEIQKNVGTSNNDMLKRISELSEILKFSEAIPSLNDIFIHCVNNESHE
ncbi:MAG: ATP-binding cassette domain-containing protein [Muribaculaceae bacterium]